MKRIFTAFCLTVIACSSDKVSSPQESLSPSITNDEKHAGMALVQSSNKSITLGSKLKVDFTYDYSIDKHEVTCGDFAKFFKNTKCSDASLPITDVTFFDAVLFANAKSKSENLDTVYTYTAATMEEDGHCSNLTGFTFHADVDAYRLPTEAEWTLAATQNWNPKESWNADNSDFELHKPCTAKEADKSGTGFCDFAGNAMEWVNDWMGALAEATVTNYAGAPDGGSLGERILKGGSYRNSVDEMTIDRRIDVYTITSSTKANYVGFRLAFGKIPDATWMDSKGEVTNSPVNILTSSTVLKKSTSTYHNKLVFRNNESGKLVFINFTNGTPRAKEIADTLQAYHPTISPDGHYIAYSTKYEGNSGVSGLYVRALDDEDSPAIKLNEKSAAIPRWSVNGADTSIIYITSTEINENEASWKKGSTWSVPFKNGEFGKPTKLFDGTFNGGVSSDNKLAVSGATRLRANVNGKNKIWYNEEQACNVSFSNLTKQTLFLDFSGKTGREFAGYRYPTHKQILIADSTGKLIKMISAPDGYTFDHTEWIQNSENLAVASLTDVDGAHTKIVLVNTKDSSITELAGGADLWHPDLWTGKIQNYETKLDVDSAGMYELNSRFTGDLSTTMTRYDLEMLYQYRDVANILISGSSRPWQGVNPIILNSSNSKNFAINIANTAVDLAVARKLMLNYGYNILPNLKVAVVSLDLDILFWRYYMYPDYWNYIYRYSPGFIYDEDHDFWSEGYPEGLYELTRDSYGENPETRAAEQEMLGFRAHPQGGWQGSPIYVDSTLLDAIDNQDDMLLEQVEDFIKEAEEKGIYLVAIIFPQSPDYRMTGSLGRYGLRRSVAIKMIEKLHKFEKTYPHFKLMDENKMGDHDYGDEDAMNCDHLSHAGANKLTERLDSLLKTLK